MTSSITRSDHAISGTVQKTVIYDHGCEIVLFVGGEDKNKIAQHFKAGSHVAAAKLNTKKPSPYGELAVSLQNSSFFEAKEVLEQIGSDEKYNAWVRRHIKSAVSGREGSEADPIEAAHVRDVADGAGMGIKNKYATIPMLASEHRLQHQQGYGAVGGLEKCHESIAQKGHAGQEHCQRHSR